MLEYYDEYIEGSKEEFAIVQDQETKTQFSLLKDTYKNFVSLAFDELTKNIWIETLSSVIETFL